MNADIAQDAHPILAAARALAPKIREASNEIERERRLTPPIVEAMKRSEHELSVPLK